MTQHATHHKLAALVSAGTVASTLLLASAAPPAGAAPTIFYTEDFEAGVGGEWTVSPAATIPTVSFGGDTGLGEFGDDTTLTLSLASLPAHDSLEVAFRFVAIDSWDGNNTGGVGPDYLDVAIDDAQQLHTTFAEEVCTGQQSYPGPYPSVNAAGAGSDPADPMFFNSGSCTGDSRKVYPITIPVAHSAGTVEIDFATPNLQAFDDERWALDDVTVSLDSAAADPELSVGDASVLECTDKAVTAKVPVTLSQPAAVKTTVTVSTTEGTATAPEDYTALSNKKVVFQPGQSAKTAAVKIACDEVDESAENLTVDVVGVTPALTVSDGSGTVTINDDDPIPTVSIADASVTECTAPKTKAVVKLTLSLSAASGRSVSVGYATADDDATAGSDYTAADGRVTIKSGALTKTISITTLCDSADEPNETFDVTLDTPTDVDIADGTATVTITDDDNPPI
jgi:hypothetical protein